MAAIGLVARRLPQSVDLRWFDMVATVAFVVIVILQEGVAKDPSAFALVAGLGCVTTIAYRRRAPATACVVTAASFAALQVWGGNADIAPTEFVIVLNTYMLGRRFGKSGSRVIAASLVATALPAIALVPGNARPTDFVPVWGFLVAIPFVVGLVIRERTDRTAGVVLAASRLEREQESTTKQVVADERAQIARELHDIIAHSVSVMVIQAAAARRMAQVDRAVSREALGSVVTSGREALDEMHRLVGVLDRDSRPVSGVGPADGLSHLPVLAARARTSGLPVDVRISGDPRPLPAALDLVAFRVIQEAITNTIKHAGPARATVQVTFASDAIELEIRDDGCATVGRSALRTSGHGLVGMRERVALQGGVLNAGRHNDGGFFVTARIPFTETSTG